jgi:hypothetical protein
MIGLDTKVLAHYYVADEGDAEAGRQSGRDRPAQPSHRHDSSEGLGEVRGLGQCAGEGSPGASKTLQDSPRLAEVGKNAMAAFTSPRPLAADDDTTAFDCGRDALNHGFRRHAWRNQELGVSRTTVICDADAGDIVGYVSLSTAQVGASLVAQVSTTQST